MRVDRIITSSQGTSNTDIVKVEARLITPVQATEIGLGNLFDSRDSAIKNYKVYVALNENNEVISGIITEKELSNELFIKS